MNNVANRIPNGFKDLCGLSVMRTPNVTSVIKVVPNQYRAQSKNSLHSRCQHSYRYNLCLSGFSTALLQPLLGLESEPHTPKLLPHTECVITMGGFFPSLRMLDDVDFHGLFTLICFNPVCIYYSLWIFFFFHLSEWFIFIDVFFPLFFCCFRWMWIFRSSQHEVKARQVLCCHLRAWCHRRAPLLSRRSRKCRASCSSKHTQIAEQETILRFVLIWCNQKYWEPRCIKHPSGPETHTRAACIEDCVTPKSCATESM